MKGKREAGGTDLYQTLRKYLQDRIYLQNICSKSRALLQEGSGFSDSVTIFCVIKNCGNLAGNFQPHVLVGMTLYDPNKTGSPLVGTFSVGMYYPKVDPLPSTGSEFKQPDFSNSEQYFRFIKSKCTLLFGNDLQEGCKQHFTGSK